LAGLRFLSETYIRFWVGLARASETHPFLPFDSASNTIRAVSPHEFALSGKKAVATIFYIPLFTSLFMIAYINSSEPFLYFLQSNKLSPQALLFRKKVIILK
jgi:hypothetical protein